FGDQPFTAQEAKEALPVSKSFLFKILHELVKEGHLTRLGRGIYAFDGSKRELAVSLSETGRKIHQALYPEGIDFAITGLDVLLTFTHHLLVRFPHLVYVQRGSAEWARETLRQEDFACLVEPTEREIRIGLELAEESELVILRETSDLYAVTRGVASVERALVDLYFESTRRGYPIPVSEVGRILFDALRSTRINYTRLLRWAMRRGIDAEIRDALAGFSPYLPIPDSILQGHREESEHTLALKEAVGAR
ncbi:MAG TPA: hypothetical protein EYP55_00945, partial [Anaerolineae bacterium]|nr:hypothetical protein [Anaerolineae bacterium]